MPLGAWSLCPEKDRRSMRDLLQVDGDFTHGLDGIGVKDGPLGLDQGGHLRRSGKGPRFHYWPT